MNAAHEHPPQAPAMPWWRAARVDVVALVAIAIGVALSHFHMVRHGMPFGDPSATFHFGRKLLDGAVPYRDYVYQAGPLPIYVDGAFQAVFGASVMASLYAAMAITIVRVFAVWLIVRRLAGWGAAALLAVWCGLDPVFAVPYHAAASYAQLFVVLAGLFLLRASDASDRLALRWLALAGASCGLVVASRQGAAVVVALVLAIAAAALHRRREFFTRPRLIALGAGFAAALIVVFAALAIQGALGPALHAMFIDAPAKKGIHGLAAVFDALSGGAMTDPYHSWWGGFLVYAGLSLAIVVGVVTLVARDRQVSSATVALTALAVLVMIGLYLRYALLGWFVDLPRMFLTAITVLVIAAPDRVRRWFGVEPVVALGLAALPLASDWALQAALPARDASDVPSLVTGALLFALASRLVVPRARTLLCGALALAAIIHFAAAFRARNHPFADADAADGTLRDTRVATPHPLLADLRISEPKKQAIDWLTANVARGSTCFIYGHAPVLYDLLDCANPTRIDSTAVGAFATADADDAVAALRRQPPDYLIAIDWTAMLLPLLAPLDQLELYSWFDPAPVGALHAGLSELLPRYQLVGIVGDIVGAPGRDKLAAQPDRLDGIRLYKRR